MEEGLLRGDELASRPRADASGQELQRVRRQGEAQEQCSEPRDELLHQVRAVSEFLAERAFVLSARLFNSSDLKSILKLVVIPFSFSPLFRSRIFLYILREQMFL